MLPNSPNNCQLCNANGMLVESLQSDQVKNTAYLPSVIRISQIILSVLVSLVCFSGAAYAAKKDCTGLYVGKKFFIGEGKYGPPNEVKIVGIDKDDELVSIEITEGLQGYRSTNSLEFNGCNKFKSAMSDAGARSSQ